MKIRAIFRKHFNAAGEADDFPTDFFLPPTDTLHNMTLIEMRPPEQGAARDEDGGAYGEEEWEYETERVNAVEAALERCQTVLSYRQLDG